jgi:hypothetical protein
MQRDRRSSAEVVHHRQRGRAELRVRDHRLGAAMLFAGLVMVTFPAGGRAPRPRTSNGTGRVAVCSFTNPAYAGECVERTDIPEESTAEEACRGILDCLNNARCPETYCRATTIRSGWVLKKAAEETSSSGS